MKCTKANSILLFLIAIVLQSCCAVEEPEFDIGPLPDAILNQVYKQVITAQIKNNPLDDSFEYVFSFSGRLPNGMSFYVVPGNRRVIIEGTPTELGEFRFTLSVKTKEKEVYDSSDNSADDFIFDLAVEITEEAACSIGSDEYTQNYKLSVLMM